MTHVDHLIVSCPTCRVGVNRRCVELLWTPVLQPSGVHPARVDAAKLAIARRGWS